MDHPFFYRYITMLNRLDLSLSKELNLLGDGSEQPNAYQRIGRRMQAGTPLSLSMQKEDQLFTQSEVAVVAAAEESEDMAGALSQLQESSHRSRGVLRPLHVSVLYGTIALIVTGFFGAATAFVIPQMLSIRRAILGPDGSAATDFLSAISGLLIFLAGSVQVGLGLSALVLAGCLVSKRMRRIVKRALSALIARLPVVGASLGDHKTGQFLLTLSSLLKGGVGAPEAIRTARAVLESDDSRDQALKAADAVAAGESLSSAMETRGLISGADAWRIALAEGTAGMPERLSRVGLQVQVRSTERLERFRRSLEPVLALAFGLVTALLAGSMFLAFNDMAEMAIRELV